MNRIITKPALTKTGVLFSVQVDSVDYPCAISNGTLSDLSALIGRRSEPMQTFLAFEEEICDEARRLIMKRTLAERRTGRGRIIVEC